MCGELAEGGGGKQLLLKQTACHKWGPQGSKLGPTLLSSLISGVDDGIQWALRKPSDDTKLGGEEDTLGQLPCRKIFVGVS